MTILAEELERYEAAQVFLRELTIPEEDRSRYTSAPWSGGYRWFRSPNVVCLEKVRAILKRGVEIGRPRGDAA
jgi:hypothetical protein